MSGLLVLDVAKHRDVTRDVTDETGRLKVMPAAFWAGTTMVERVLFGHKNGSYLLPTFELVDRLRDIIAGRPAIEIGAGNGVLAEALGIPATDSRQHELPEVAMQYQLCRQPTVTYGPNIEHLSAVAAVRHYRPKVVIASWVSRRYEPGDQARGIAAGGNPGGVDESAIIEQCETYVLIGNQETHRLNKVWRYQPEVEFPPYLFSRAGNGTPDFIAIINR